MSNPETSKRMIGLAIIFFLMAGAGIGWAAIPQNTIRNNAGIVFPTVNATAGYWVGTNEVINGTRAAFFSDITDTGLVPGRVVYVGLGGILVDDADLTFVGTTLTATNVISTSYTIGADTLNTTEWANLDGQDQTVSTGSSVDFIDIDVAEYYLSSVNKTDIFKYPEQTSSYIISTDGTNYFAKNGTTGAIDFVGTNATAIIQSAIDGLRGIGGTVFIKKGIYPTDATITLWGGIGLQGETTGWETGGPSPVIQSFGLATPVIEIKADPLHAGFNLFPFVRDITIVGNAAQPNNHGISVPAGATVLDAFFTNVNIHNAGGFGFYFDQGGKFWVRDCYAEYNEKGGIYIHALKVRIEGSYIFDNDEYGIQIVDIIGARVVITENYIENNHFDGIYQSPTYSNTSMLLITNNIINSNGVGGDYANIYIRGIFNFQISDNYITDTRQPAQTRNGIVSRNTETNGIITGNVFTNTYVTSEISWFNSPTLRIHNNKGYVTENSGTATLYNLTSSITVAHGGSFTPTVEDIGITFSTSLANCTQWWVTGIDATNFVLNVGSAGAAKKTSTNIDFGWNLDRN